jgi:DNA-binding NtrC family response regulator
MARILIVDDDEVTRVQLGGLLQPEHDVNYASNGDVALKLCRPGRFQVCVLDLFMPVKNGLQTIQDFAEIDPDLKIIAITGEDPELNLDVAKDLGALQTLAKPVMAEALQTAVAAALEDSTG